MKKGILILFLVSLPFVFSFSIFRERATNRIRHNSPSVKISGQESICELADSIYSLQADYEVPDLVPFDQIRNIVHKYAKKRWGDVKIGTPVPCCDRSGKIRVYMFPVCIDPKTILNEKNILESVYKGIKLLNREQNQSQSYNEENFYAERDRLIFDSDRYSQKCPFTSSQKLELGRKLMWGTDNFKTIVVSARYSEFPIPAIFHSLPPFYAIGPLALKQAKEALKNPDVRLVRCYFIDHGFTYFEFISYNQEILIRSDPSLYVCNKEIILNRTRIDFSSSNMSKTLIKNKNEIEHQNIKTWEKYLSGDIPSDARYYVDGMAEETDSNNKRWVPWFSWSGGCTPTAAAMAMGYWDNYIFGNGGTVDNNHFYGRLIDYYMISPYRFCSDPMKYVEKTPNLLYELRQSMGTYCQDLNGNGKYDRGEYGITDPWNISSGIKSAANSNHNNYNFGSEFYFSIFGVDPIDLIWNLIKTEVLNSRPFMYSVARIGPFIIAPDSGHSLCGIGYTDNRYVIVLDPNCSTQQEWQLNYWEYNPKGHAWGVSVNTVWPGGSDGNNQLFLKYPRGGQHFDADSPCRIKWRQWGGQIRSINIYFSSKGGNRGSKFISTCSSYEGDNNNEYVWYPNISTTTGRIEIRDSRDQNLASDSSLYLITIDPIGVSPTDRAKINTLMPTFKWTPYDSFYEQLGYQLQVYCDTDGNRKVYDTGYIPSSNASSHKYQRAGTYTGYCPIAPTNRVSESLKYEKHYHWMIRYFYSYKNSTIKTDWSNDTVETQQDFYTHPSGRYFLEVLSTSGGTTIPEPEVYFYNPGNLVSLKAISNAEYRFARWTGDIQNQIELNNNITILMDKNKSVKAHFCSKCGDVNGDQNISPADAQLAFDIYLGKVINPTVCQMENADVNCNGTKLNPWVETEDAREIFEKFLGKSELTCDCLAESRSISFQGIKSFIAKNIEISYFITDHNDRIIVPIFIENSKGVDAFGFDFMYPSEYLEFIALEKSDVLDAFHQVDANTIADGILRVGGYSSEPINNLSSVRLLTLIFRNIKHMEKSPSFKIINTVGDFINASVKKMGK